MNEIKNGEAFVLLHDGARIVFPLEKLPKGVGIGTFLSISIRVDHIAALLSSTAAKLAPGGQH